MRGRENSRFLKVYCNACGKKLYVKHGIVLEGCNSFTVEWDYFSEKDGEIHRFDLCEECYDKFIKTFKISVEKYYIM